jgi:hypothetical protein
MFNWEQAVSGDAAVPVSGDAAVPVSGDAAVPVSGDAATPLFQTFWDFGDTTATLKLGKGRWCISVWRLKKQWKPTDELSKEQYDRQFSRLLPDGFEPELEPEKFCFFEHDEKLFLKVSGKDNRILVIHPETGKAATNKVA